MQGEKSLKQKGTEQFKKNNYHRALQYYSSYIQEQHNDNMQTMLNMALCYFKLQDYDNSINMCNQILEIDDKYYKCYYRRAMCRKEILDKDRDNLVERYRLYYDCLMFQKYSDPKGLERELDEFALIAKNCKELITPCQPTKISSFERSLIELEKDNISLYAISELEQKFASLSIGDQNDHRQQINRLYKEMTVVKRQVKDPEQLKIMVDLITDKIKLLRKDMQAKKQAQSCSKQQQQKSVTTDTKESKQQLNNKMDVIGQIKNQPDTPTEAEYSSPESKQQQHEVVQNENVSNNLVNVVHINLPEREANRIQVEPTAAEQETNKPKQQQAKQVNLEIRQEANNKVVQPIQIGEQKSKLPQIDKNCSVQSLLHMIKQQMSKSRDAFNQFSKILIQILNSPQVPQTTKQELLKIIPKSIANFKLTILGIPKSTKEKLKQAINNVQISQQIQKYYIK